MTLARFMNLTTRFVSHTKQSPVSCFLMESSLLNGYAKDFKKDVINVAAALIKKHRDIVYDLALEAQNAINERNAMKEKDKNSKAEQDAVSIIQNPEYKNLVQEG